MSGTKSTNPTKQTTEHTPDTPTTDEIAEICCGCGSPLDETHFDPCVCIRCISAIRPSPSADEICASCRNEMEAILAL